MYIGTYISPPLSSLLKSYPNKCFFLRHRDLLPAACMASWIFARKGLVISLLRLIYIEHRNCLLYLDSEQNRKSGMKDHNFKNMYKILNTIN